MMLTVVVFPGAGAAGTPHGLRGLPAVRPASWSTVPRGGYLGFFWHGAVFSFVAYDGDRLAAELDHRRRPPIRRTIQERGRSAPAMISGTGIFTLLRRRVRRRPRGVVRSSPGHRLVPQAAILARRIMSGVYHAGQMARRRAPSAGLLGPMTLADKKIGAAFGRPSNRFLMMRAAAQFGTAAFGLGGNAASVIVPRRRSSASLSARSSFSSGGT